LQILIRSCKCVTGIEIKDFFNISSIVTTLGRRISSYTGGTSKGRGNYSTEVDKLKTRLFELQEYISINSPNCNWTFVSFTLNEILTVNTKISIDFDSYAEANKPPSAAACTKTCSTQNFTKIPTIDLGLDNLEKIIKDLNGTVDAEYREFVLSFWNRLVAIRSGISSFRQYVIEWQYNMDIGFIDQRCSELYEWYVTLTSDLQRFRIQINDVSEYCATSCPNERFVYDAASCKCSCSLTCVSGSKFDLLNCRCLNKTDPGYSCQLTNEGCMQSSQILNYESCACQTPPGYM